MSIALFWGNARSQDVRRWLLVIIRSKSFQANFRLVTKLATHLLRAAEEDFEIYART